MERTVEVSHRSGGRALMLMLLAAAMVCTACTSAVSAGNSSAVGSQQTPAPHTWWWGITVDSIEELRDTVTAVADLPVAPVVRVVFDLGEDPDSYVDAVTRLAEHAELMALVVDSSGFAELTGADYLTRFTAYVSRFGDQISLWEIGNESNGEWLGESSNVVAAVTGADLIVRQRGLTSVLTLYYNPNCAQDAGHDMFTWARDQLTPEFRESLPYVLLSYYPDECNGFWPDRASWQQTFDRVGDLFPNAEVGIGEVGISDDTGSTADKVDLLNHCYGLRVDSARFLGGCFWWYFVEDAVPTADNPVWNALAQNMTAG